MRLKLYTAGKLHHLDIFVSLREAWPEFGFTARWVEHVLAGREETEQNAAAFWQENEADIADSDALLLYAKPGDALRGTLVEVGIAIAHLIPVIACAPSALLGTWQAHPRIQHVPDLGAARAALLRLSPPPAELVRG